MTFHNVVSQETCISYDTQDIILIGLLKRKVKYTNSNKESNIKRQRNFKSQSRAKPILGQAIHMNMVFFQKILGISLFISKFTF